jgi:hypothetical protein
LDKIVRMTTTQEPVSTFALMVDKLRMMDEAELKLAYIKLFKNELAAEWKELIDEMNFGDSTDEDINKTFYSQRYPSKA